MMLLDVLSKDGAISLVPAGMQGDLPCAGEVSEKWFAMNFPKIANAQVPLELNVFEELKNIDYFWKQNAERWRTEGLI